jgi:hypothetical protein
MALKITSSGVWDMCVRLKFCSTKHHYLRPGWSLMIFTHLVFTLGHTCMNCVWTSCSCSTAGGTFRHRRSVVSAVSPQRDLWKLVEARGRRQRSYNSVFPDELPSCPSLYRDLDSLSSMAQVVMMKMKISFICEWNQSEFVVLQLCTSWILLAATC